MLRIAISAIIFGVWLYSLYFDVMNIPVIRAGSTWFAKLKFLTILNMVIETVYFCLCTIRAIIDQLSSPKRNRRDSGLPTYYPDSRLHRFCDKLYAAVVFPLGLFVVIMFWALYCIDRELVYPKALDRVIPQWLNHVMHTSPVPFLLVDTLLVCHKYPSRRNGIRLLVLLGLGYVTSIFAWYFFHDWWVYPIFDVMNWTQRFIFCAVGLFMFVLLYLAGEGLNRLLWGEASHPTPEEEANIAAQGLKAGRQQLKKSRRD